MELDPAAVGVTVTIVIALGAFALYVIRGEIAKANRERQPRNGGTGWQDVHSKLDTVITRQSEVVADVRYLRERVDRHVDDHDHHSIPHYRRTSDTN